MAKTPEEQLNDKNKLEELSKKKLADDDFAQLCFTKMLEENRKKAQGKQNQSLIRLLTPKLKKDNPSAAEVEEAKKNALEKIKSDTPITLEVKGNQILAITFKHAETSFVFSTASPEGCAESVEFMKVFQEAFQQKNNNEKPYYHLIVHEEESLEEALRALDAKGIKVNEITLHYENGVKKEFSDKEMKVVYEILNQPDPNSSSNHDQKSSRCSML